MTTITYKDRVRENCTFDTVNNVTLNGATIGFTTFDNGDIDYLLTTIDESLWEVGKGSVLAGVLTRTTVEANSAGTLAKIDFGVVSGIAGFSLTATKTNTISDKMEWLGDWVSNLYNKNAVVRDGDWTMICNVDAGCDERPAPHAIGSSAYVYSGTLDAPDPSISAKQIIFGARYSVDADTEGYINGYRIYTIIDQVYQVYTVKDPLGTPIINNILTFTGVVDDWHELNISPVLIPAGTVFDLVVVTHEPDPAPTEWSAPWNYSTPNNAVDPIAGQIIQASKESNVIKIHLTDDNGDDDTTRPVGNDISALVHGDLISGAGEEWVIQSVTDNTTFYSFQVSPVLQGSILGLNTFTFGTVSATPIDYVQETDYNVDPSAVKGLFGGAGVLYADIVADDNQYGVDLLVQDAFISDQWEVIAYSGKA